MKSHPPGLIAIDHDEYHASHVGRAQDGSQFFITTPFIPALGPEPGCEFLAIYRFDQHGKLLDAQVENLGPRDALDRDRARQLLQQHLTEMGRFEYGRIEVQPFEIERFGTTFGLVPRPPEDDGDSWWVEVQPGNYMAFHEPWDSGEYDT